MRYLFTPKELTVPALLTLDTLAEEARRYLEGPLAERIDRAQFDAALEELEALQKVAWEQRARYTFAIHTLYRAEILRRQCRWEEALKELERALPWLDTRVDTDARYDEAVALYLEGMLHYRLHADQAARETFIRAQALLRHSEEDWLYRLEEEKLVVGRRLYRWIEGLLHLQPLTPPLTRRLIVPLYTAAHRTYEIEPVIIPAEGGEIALDDRTCRCRLLEARASSLAPFCDRFYFALRLQEAEAPHLPDGRPGDLVVMMREGPLPPTAEEALALRSFRRYADGRIVWEDEEQAVLKVGSPPCMLCHIEATSSDRGTVQGGPK